VTSHDPDRTPDRFALPSTLRRAFVAALCLACGGVGSAAAQGAFPSRAITIVVPFTAGGFSDTVARSVGAGLSQRLNVPVVIDNRPGGGGLIGAGAVVRAAADGYTLFLANISTNAINPNIYKKSPFDVGEELDPVVMVAMTPNVLAVGMEVPAKTVKELVELARTRQLSFGTPGTGSSGHLSGELFARRADLKFLHVPYKGSPQVLPDVVNGSLQFTIDNILTWAPLVKGERVRALAVTGLKRSPLLPDVPTLDESGYPGFQATSWFGLAAPKGTPRDVIGRLNAEVNAVLETPEFRQKVTGAEVVGGTAESFRSFIATERQKWGEVTRAISLTAD
jgi:tripartite-type tricarboxylate transporter receptor subunit TctC